MILIDNRLIDNGYWNVSQLNEFLDRDTVNAILAVNIPIIDVEDKFVWCPSPNGRFLVKIVTWLQYKNLNTRRLII